MKKRFTFIVICAVLFCFAVVYENSSLLKNISFASNSVVITENDNRKFVGAKTFDEMSYKYEDVLNDIKKSFENQKYSVNLKSYKITHDELNQLVNYLINDGYYYVNTSYLYYTDGEYIVSFKPEYLMTPDEVEKYNAEINSSIDEVVKNTSKYKNNIEKLIYIHNYLVENIEYDIDGDNSVNNLYGAFILKKTMCAGYSQAFYHIAEKAGFKTYIVSSETLKHAWNMVNLNGKYYFVDCTWDDPVFDEINLSNDPVSGYGCYKYFMCSEDFFIKNEHNADDFVVNTESVMGIVTSTDYDDFFWRDYQALMKYSNGSWYHDYGYSDKNVHTPRDVKFSIDRITFSNNKNYDKKIVRTISACWKYGFEYYAEFNTTLQSIDDFLYYFKDDGIYKLEEDGRFNGKNDLLVFKNPTEENIYDFAVDTENGSFTVMYGSLNEFTESNGTEKTYNIADYFCKVQKHQYVLDYEVEETGEKVYICTACRKTMKETA